MEGKFSLEQSLYIAHCCPANWLITVHYVCIKSFLAAFRSLARQNACDVFQ